jgi:uncharacterized protein (UPF0276 family)
MMTPSNDFNRALPARPDLGVGVGLRSNHYGAILSQRPAIPWFEVISENFMTLRNTDPESRGLPGGRPREVLDLIRKDYPIMLHGVSLNIGSTDPLRLDYLKKLKVLAEETQPLWVSDHLCWTGVEGENLHDLLPIPYTEEALAHVVERVKQVQDILGRRILLENVSSYVSYKHSEMPEWEFVAELARRADCGILLDVNNVFVSATNHGFDPKKYLDGIPVDRVRQMHLAGYSEQDTGFLIDTHDHPVTSPVWDLYRESVRRFGAVPALIEWDDKIPPFDVLEKEAKKAEEIREEVLGAKRHEVQAVA